MHGCVGKVATTWQSWVLAMLGFKINTQSTARSTTDGNVVPGAPSLGGVLDVDQRRRLRSYGWDYGPRQQWRGCFLSNDLGHQKSGGLFFPVAGLFVASQYEIPFKLSISTFHVRVMAITPAIASHKVRHPSLPSNFSVFTASRQKS
jgi:hypothetical protein